MDTVVNMETVRNTIAENIGGLGHKLASEENTFTLEEVPDLSGKVAVVTGGSEGETYSNNQIREIRKANKHIRHRFRLHPHPAHQEHLEALRPIPPQRSSR